MEDSGIILLFQQRDPNAIQELSDKYSPYFKKIARNILENAQDVEECLNDALLRVWDSIPPNEPENLCAYVGKIIRNLAINRHRDSQRIKRGCGQTETVLNELHQITFDESTPEQAFDRKLLLEEINAFLRDLPVWKRYIFVRRYWYADSVQDISKACGKSENHVSMTLTRLRRKLEDHLKERGVDL